MTAAVVPKSARVFRSGGIRFAGWAWMIFAVLNLADLAWRGRDAASAVAAAVMLLGCGVAYAVALRPRIVADDEAVHFHNLLRDIRLPWGSVDRFEGGDAVYACVGEQRYRAFILQTSPRARAKSEMRAQREDKKLPDAVADYMRGRTATDFTVEQLREIIEQNRKEGAEPGEVTTTWSRAALLAFAAPGLLTLATIVVAMV
ncbi:PH domain-containing protein [Actinomadura sp. DC4]|uniref:PH domain-containing protein n=1 Tax=Actinomadura sp. DC4 TaxID=3055069 RepID=UPI0025B00D2C|nr:PH domain-containing protein [Actinomadura sp. DC4]MDN3357097.1 PH domain-containing protein [Actinomadura sp. DC4]